MGRLLGIVGVTAILAAVAPGRFGGQDEGPLRWEAAPRASAVAGAGGDHLLFGHVVNRSDGVVRLRAADVRVRSAGGDELATSAAYAGGFVASVSLRGHGDEVFAGAGAGAAVGREVTLRPGEAVPLSVSFTIAPGGEKAVAIDYGEGTLALE